jgi:2-polyprenyl-3-methyl-5-hydroxy-6-metoxy-1,4-benzoquinol methylase
MPNKEIWDSYASWYEKLLAQKFALGPSRKLILKNLSEIPENAKILDVGCAIGQLCREIKSIHPTANITGIDPAEKMIERAKMLSENIDIRYVATELEKLPENEKFDIIVSTNAFPYVMDKKFFLKCVKNHLNPGGRLLILFANNNNFYDALWLVFVKLTTSKAEYLSNKKMSSLLKICNFNIKSIQRIETAFFIPSVYMFECTT